MNNNFLILFCKYVGVLSKNVDLKVNNENSSETKDVNIVFKLCQPAICKPLRTCWCCVPIGKTKMSNNNQPISGFGSVENDVNRKIWPCYTNKDDCKRECKSQE